MQEDLRRRIRVLIRSMLPRRVKRHRILAGPLTGKVLVTSWADYPGAILGYTEAALLAWIARNVNPGETWLDVGAHYGYTALAFAQQVGSAGRVFAFEPMIRTADHLSETRSLNAMTNITVVPVGLSSNRQLAAVEVATTRGMADATLASQQTERISLVALDSLWPRISNGNPIVHGVKVDVQGMEFDALLGMTDTLRRSRPSLIIEFHSGVSRNRVLDLLESLGYQRRAMPLPEGFSVDDTSKLRDDTSYAFHALSTAAE